jgi:hypothetical protein
MEGAKDFDVRGRCFAGYVKIKVWDISDWWLII